MCRRLILFTGMALLVASAASAQQIIPAEGRNDVRLTNRSRLDAVFVTLRYEATDHDAALPPPIRLEPGQQVVLRNVVESLFGLTTDTAGEIFVSGPDLVAAEWRSNSGSAVGAWLPAIAADGAPVRRRAARSASPPDPPTLVRVGDTATFSGSYGVSGTATIIAKNVIRVTKLRNNGTAPGLDLRVGLSTTSRKTFTVLQVTGRQVLNDATLELTLPDNVDLNSFDTFTVWCYEFSVIIAEGRFRRP